MKGEGSAHLTDPSHINVLPYKGRIKETSRSGRRKRAAAQEATVRQRSEVEPPGGAVAWHAVRVHILQQRDERRGVSLRSSRYISLPRCRESS